MKSVVSLVYQVFSVRRVCFFLSALFLAWAFLGANLAEAQFMRDPFLQEEFRDSAEENFEERPLYEEESQQDLRDEFLEEEEALREEFFQSEEVRDVQSAQRSLAVEKEVNLLPSNIIWGGATGLLIGGWFGLTTRSDTRTSLRYVGSGMVYGVLLGALVGMRSTIAPSSPQPAQREKESLPIVLAPIFKGSPQFFSTSKTSKQADFKMKWGLSFGMRF